VRLSSYGAADRNASRHVVPAMGQAATEPSNSAVTKSSL
jgi:hypothetical protein